MEKAPELAAIPKAMPEKAAKVSKASQSRTNQKDEKESEKASVLKELTGKKREPQKKGHGRKKPTRTEESR